jgi:hypothetical protein
VTITELLAGPPPEVLDEIGVAWERAEALTAAGWTLDLARDGGVSGRLRGPAGARSRRLTASEVLALVCGDLAPDAVPLR